MIRAKRTKEGLRALERGRAANPEVVARYLESKFGEALGALGLTRRVGLAIPSLSAAALAVSESDMVLTGARREIERLAALLPLEVFETPVTIAPFELSLYWHERLASDPFHAWIREKLAETVTAGAVRDRIGVDPYEAGVRLEATERRSGLPTAWMNAKALVVRVILAMVLLMVGGCTKSIDVSAADELLFQGGPGVMAGIQIGDSWSKVKANADPRWRVWDEGEHHQLRYEASGNAGDNGWFVAVTLDGDRVASYEVHVSIRETNKEAFVKLLLRTKARLLARLGPSGRCDTELPTAKKSAVCSFGLGPDDKAGLSATLQHFPAHERGESFTVSVVEYRAPGKRQ